MERTSILLVAMRFNDVISNTVEPLLNAIFNNSNLPSTRTTLKPLIYGPRLDCSLRISQVRVHAVCFHAKIF